MCVWVQCLDFGEGLVTGDLCEDLCVLHLVDYKRCLYYENGKKVMEVRWRGQPVVLKSKLENFSSYEPLGILDYQVFLSTVWTLTETANQRLLVVVPVVSGATLEAGSSRTALPSGGGLLRNHGSR